MNKRIRKIRTDNKLNKSEFAKKIGTSAMSVTNMEKENGNYPNTLTIKKICQVFNIDANWLLFGDDRLPHSVKSINDKMQESQNSHNEINTKKRTIEDLLVDMGIRISRIGFLYLVDAVLIYDRNMRLYEDVYAKIAESRNVSVATVERAIRSALKSAIFFPSEISKTNGDSIAYLSLVADRIMEDERKKQDLARSN